MKKPTLFLISLWLFMTTAIGQSDKILWYKQAANHFEESLVLGNGRVGATVFGGVASDKIYLNDATLWTGEPVNANMNPEAYKNVPLIRAALEKEDYKLADSLQHKLQGKFSESYAPLGTLFIEFEKRDTFQNYYRELDISQAIAKTIYKRNGVDFSREYFVSNPDKVLIIKLKSSQKGGLTFNLTFNSLLKNKVKTANQTLQANGYAPTKAEPSYRGNMPNAVVFTEGKGTRFTTLAKLKNT